MRAFLTIIRDCFHEALVSKVLWILFLLVTVFLLAIAPFGIEEGSSPFVSANDVRDPRGFVNKLVAGESAPAKLVKQLWGEVKVASLHKQGEFEAEAVAAEINTILANPDFRNSAAWNEAKLNREAAELRGKNPQERREQLQLARLLLESAFPDDFDPMDLDGVLFSYAGYEFNDDPLPGSKKRALDETFNFLVTALLGAIGVFAAILVTSTIMPRTFEAGEIDLLLSKPVSRSLVYLAKYAGGCAFISLLSAYFLAGLWLVAGLRLGYWNRGLLNCIPLCIFIFAIYYSVSALAGAIWRNAIISIVVSILFWVVCFGIGTTKDVIEVTYIIPSRLVAILPNSEAPIGINAKGGVLKWNPGESKWSRLRSNDPSLPDFDAPVPLPNAWVGPVWDEQNEQILLVRRELNQNLTFGSRKAALFHAGPANDWMLESSGDGIISPGGLYIDANGAPLCVARSSFNTIHTEIVPSDKPNTKPVQMVKADPIGGNPGLSNRFAVNYDVVNDRVAALDSSGVSIWNRASGGGFEKSVGAPLEFDGIGLTAIGGKHAVVALEDGRVQMRSATDLNLVKEYRPEGEDRPRFAACSPDGRWFVVAFQTGAIWVWDSQSQNAHRGGPAALSDVGAIAFDRENNFYVCNKKDGIVVFDGSGLKKKATFAPEPSVLDRIYFTGIRPLHYVFPKPRELAKLTSFCLTGKRSVAMVNTGSLDDPQMELKVWQPIVSNLLFIAAMLLLGSLYVSRRDF